jgi:hypothetical protein
MSNPITYIKFKPVITLADLVKEYERQWLIVQEKRKEAQKLHLHNAFEIDYYEFQTIAINLIQREYGFSEKVAQLIETKCYEDYHSSFGDYLINLSSFGYFVKELFAIK